METIEDSLEHYGVKGMKWGVRRDQATLDRAAGRKTNKLNKASRRADIKGAKSNRYSKNLKDADSRAIKTLSPTSYARYLTSGARTSQVTREKLLRKSAEKGRKKVDKLLSNIPDGYSAVYDITKNAYSLKRI